MATRLYLHNATSALANLPTAEQSTALTATLNADAQTVNKTMTTTIGTSQVQLRIATNAATTQQTLYFTRFVSDPINQTSIAANTWTYNFALRESTAAANFPVGVSGPTCAVCYVWRPGTGKVGTIIDSATGTANVVEALTSIGSFNTTFSGSAVSSLQSGDVICLEIWFQVTQGNATTRNDDFLYDGTTVDTTSGTVVTNHASFLETPENIAFVQYVSQTSIQEYNVNAMVSQTSKARYHVGDLVLSTKTGIVTKDTTTGAHTQSFSTELGFRPMAMIFFTLPNTATGIATQTHMSIGMTDGTNHFTSSFYARDNTNSGSQVATRNINTRAIVVENAATLNTTTLSEATVTFQDNGWDFVWTKANATANKIGYWAIGGNKISEAKLTSQTHAGTGSRTYSTTGFQGDIAFFLGCGLGIASSAAAGGLSFGVATASNQFCTNVSNNTPFPLLSARHQYTNKCMRVVSGGTTEAVRTDVAFTAFTSTGYTLNYTNSTADQFAALVIKGGLWDVGSFNQNTSNGTQQVNITTGRDPKAVLLASFGNVSSSSAIADARQSFGLMDGTTEMSTWVGFESGATTQVSKTDFSDTKALRMLDETSGGGTLQTETDWSSFQTGSFTINNTTTDATSRQICYVVLSDVVTTVNVSQTSIQEFDVLQNASLTNIEKYDVAQMQSQQSINKYHVAQLQSQTNVEKWHVMQNTSLQSIQKYHAFQNATLQSIEKYDVRANTQQPSIEKYHVAQNTQQQSIQKWNVLQLTSLTSIHKFDVLEVWNTKLYLHTAVYPIANLPTTEQSTKTSTRSWTNADNNRAMNQTIGSAYTAIADTPPSGSAFVMFVAKWVSQRMKGVTTIDAQKWTLNFAARVSNVDANFPVNGVDKSIYVNCFVWRPSTQAKVGTILDGNSNAVYDEPNVSASTRVMHGNFAGAQVTGIQDGDVIVIELWHDYGSNANSRTIEIAIDGANEITTENAAAAAGLAAFLGIYQTLNFFYDYASQQSISKYHVLQNILAQSIEKWHVLVNVTALTNIHKWHVRQLQQSLSVQKWDVRQLIQGLNIQKWNVLQLIQSLTNIHKYNIAQLTSQFSNQKYTVLQNATLQAVHKWAVLQNATLTTIQKYDVRQNISRLSIQSWDVLALIAATNIHKFDVQVRTLVSALAGHPYNVLQNVARTNGHPYHVMQNILQTTIQKYHVRQLISEVSTHLWDVQVFGLVGHALIAKYHVFENVASNSVQKWNVLQTVQALTNIHKWHVFVNVSLSSAHKWNVLQLAMLQAIHKWDVLQNVTALTSIHKYNIAQMIAGQSIQKYNALQNAMAQSIEKYDVLMNVAALNIEKYNLAHLLQVANTQGYNIAKLIAAASIHKFDVLALGMVSAALLTKYHILELVAALPSVQKYTVLQNVSLSLATKWNVLQNATLTSIHKFDIRALSSALTGHPYNILQNVSAFNTQPSIVLQNVMNTSKHAYDVITAVLVATVSAHVYNISQNILESSVHKWNTFERVSANVVHPFLILQGVASSMGHIYHVLQNARVESKHKFNVFSHAKEIARRLGYRLFMDRVKQDTDDWGQQEQ